MVLGRALGIRFLWTDWTERDLRTLVWNPYLRTRVLEDLGSWRKQIAAGSTEIILPGARCVLASVCWKLSISSVAKRQWSELAHLFAIEFVVGLKNNEFACFSLVPLTVSMGDTCVCIFNDTACNLS
jgi:hypothetical protein